MFARGANLGFAFEKLLVAPQRRTAATFPPPHLGQALSKISKIWIGQALSKSQKFGSYRKIVDPILKKIGSEPA